MHSLQTNNRASFTAETTTQWAGLRYAWIVLALATVALVFCCKLGSPPLWGDEADTGILSRNVLRVGYPVAYDDRNVTADENGLQFNQHLVCKTIPWLQYYLGALSLTLFGNDAAGLRLVFAIIGVLGFFPIYATLKERIKYPALITGLALLTPQIVLFDRSARYYSTLIFLYAALVWCLSVGFKSARRRIAAFGALLSLLLFTHSVAGIGCCLSLVLFCLLFRRDVLASACLAAGIAFAGWLAWYIILGPALAEPPLIIGMVNTDFASWLQLFFSGLAAVAIDIDAVGCFPILLWLLLGGFLAWRDRQAVFQLLGQPLPGFILVSLVVQAIVTAALFGYETGERFALLRYIPHLLVFLVLSCFVLLDFTISRKPLFVAASLVAVCFNVFSASFWAQSSARHVPVSWVAPVYRELFVPPQTALDTIIAKLRDESLLRPDRNEKIAVFPPWTNNVALFYLGDQYFLPPGVDAAAVECKQAIRAALGTESYQRLLGPPEWLLDVGGFVKRVPMNYQLAEEIPSSQVRPDDGSRPELTRHRFAQSQNVASVRLFQLQRR